MSKKEPRPTLDEHISIARNVRQMEAWSRDLLIRCGNSMPQSRAAVRSLAKLAKVISQVKSDLEDAMLADCREEIAEWEKTPGNDPIHIYYGGENNLVDYKHK